MKDKKRLFSGDFGSCHVILVLFLLRLFDILPVPETSSSTSKTSTPSIIRFTVTFASISGDYDSLGFGVGAFTILNEILLPRCFSDPKAGGYRIE